LLDGLGVTVFAEVATPGDGRHFYIAGHPDLASVHAPGLDGYPGVDIQSFKTNVFLPRTSRPKYDGKGYTIVFNNLAALADGGDPVGAEIFAGWVADNRVSKPESFEPSEPWDGAPPVARQLTYLGAVLRNQHRKVAEAKPGGRNTALYNAAMACGNFIAGAGLDPADAITTLLMAANHCGLIADDGEPSVLASIRSGIHNGRTRPRAVPPDERNGQAGDDPGTVPDDDQGNGTWEPIDLGPFLDGTHTQPDPTLGMSRSDGLRLIYTGKEHAVIGEMESGKSWLLAGCAAAELAAGKRVVYIHFEESDPTGTVEKLQIFGVQAATIRELFRFVGPNEPVRVGWLEALLDPTPTLVCLDGVNEAMSMHSMCIREEDGAAAFAAGW
jgi:hypothetical protein